MTDDRPTAPPPLPGAPDHAALWQGLLALHADRRDAIRKAFGRSLPLADELLDRWERARYLGFGAGASVYDSALVLGDVSVGEQTWIGPGCILDGSGGLTVGRYCSIAAGCHLYSHDSVEWALSGGKRPYVRRPTVVGDACYLGPQTVVTAGASIGRHCLIGALSLVKGDIPDYSIAVGIPARVVGSVEVAADGSVRLIYAGQPEGS